MPEPTMNPRLDVLLSRAADEAATMKEWRELEALLAADPAARCRYVQMMDLHAELRARHAGAISPSAAQKIAKSADRFTWLSWRQLFAAAAGLVLGMFCTSVVMAYMTPSAGKSFTLFSDGFEEHAQQWSHGFPEAPGIWGGDAGEVVSASGEIQPLEGLRMARLDPSPTATLSYLDRIVDVQSLPVPQGNEVRQVTVTASFHAAERGLRDRYTLRVAAFADAPAHWVGREWKEIEGALSASKRGLSTTVDAEGWQTLTATVEVPREARSLVLSLASGVFQNPDRKTAHYIDGVQVTLSISSQPVKTKARRLNLTDR